MLRHTRVFDCTSLADVVFRAVEGVMYIVAVSFVPLRGEGAARGAVHILSAGDASKPACAMIDATIVGQDHRPRLFKAATYSVARMHGMAACAFASCIMNPTGYCGELARSRSVICWLTLRRHPQGKLEVRHTLMTPPQVLSMIRPPISALCARENFHSPSQASTSSTRSPQWDGSSANWACGKPTAGTTSGWQSLHRRLTVLS